MSKLAHSHQKTMDELDAERALNAGDEDLFGLKWIGKPRCDAKTSARIFRPDGGRCPYSPVYEFPDGARLCRMHTIMRLKKGRGDE